MGKYRDLFDLTGRVALVVGAASGLGRASALALADCGALVVAADRDASGLQTLMDELAATRGESDGAGDQASAAGFDESRTVALDIRNRDQVRRVIATIVERHGRLDVAVTTPSINIRKPLLAYTDDELDRVLDLNLKGTFNVLVEAGRVMAERGQGSLIAFASIRAQVVEPGQGVYAATKAGTVQLIKTLAAELGPRGVRANAVAPGIIDTPLTQPIKDHRDWYGAYAAKTALGRWGTPEEVAAAVVFLAADASRYVTGTVLTVDGGWTAIDGRYVPPLSP